nr:2-C-methyl-D-erythritol 4-phosphate cytidylyltransferase [Rhodohalobacter sp. SW132]
MIIPAAGQGKRMQSETPKPYLELKGITILERTLSAFSEISGLCQVIVSTSSQYEEQTRKLLKRKFPDISVDVVSGGRERQHSIYNALMVVLDEADLIAVHDAVRPFVLDSTISQCLRKAYETGGAIPGVPVKDTIKRVDSKGFITQTPDRTDLWQAQTPQIFKKEILLKAYKNAIKKDFLGTDDASLVEAIGERVSVVKGNRNNFKITYPLDFRIAELLTDENYHG